MNSNVGLIGRTVLGAALLLRRGGGGGGEGQFQRKTASTRKPCRASQLRM